MYRIKVFDSRCNEILTTFTGDGGKNSGDGLHLNGWSLRINGWGAMSFSINQFSEKATEQNLCPYNRVQLFRQNQVGTYVPVWSGYIESLRTISTVELGTRLEIGCVGMEKFFRKRWFFNRTVVGNGADNALEFLDLANALDTTCINPGTFIDNLPVNLEVENSTYFQALEELSRASQSEFRIDENFLFHFVPTLGQDQSSVIQLSFNRLGSYGSNISSLDRSQFGEDMVNILHARNKDLASQTVINQESIDKFGTLERSRTFNEAQDVDTLKQMAETYVNQYSIPDISITMIPEQARLRCPSGEFVGVAYGDIDLGDIVTNRINTENTSSVIAQRVAEISVTVDDNALETVGYSMSPIDSYITTSFLREDEVAELRRRLDEAGL